MNEANAVPTGMAGLIPHLTIRGAAQAMDFYAKAFGAVELARLPTPDGRLMHGMMRIRDGVFMLNDEFPQQGCLGPQALQGSPVTLHLYVEDVDAALARAEAAGARVLMPAADMFWGDRYGRLEDPFGHQWSLATHLRDVAPEELQKAAAAMCADMPQEAR